MHSNLCQRVVARWSDCRHVLPPPMGTIRLKASVQIALRNPLALQAVITVPYLTHVQPLKLVPVQTSKLLPELAPRVRMTSAGTGHAGPLKTLLLQVEHLHSQVGPRALLNLLAKTVRDHYQEWPPCQAWSLWAPRDELGGRVGRALPMHSMAFAPWSPWGPRDELGGRAGMAAIMHSSIWVILSLSASMATPVPSPGCLLLSSVFLILSFSTSMVAIT